MRIIIDECVPSIVKRHLTRCGWATESVQSLGWSGVKNGELIRRVAAGFEIFITCDKNMRHQQNLSQLGVAILILPSNQLPIVVDLLSDVNDVIPTIESGEIREL